MTNSSIKNALLKTKIHNKPQSRKEKEKKYKRKSAITLLKELVIKYKASTELVEDLKIIIKKLKTKL